MSQHDYVEACNEWYDYEGIIPGDERVGVWEEAHYPLPQSQGNETVLLLRHHHAVQGVLQSEEVGYPCIFNWEKKYLDGWLLERLHYWRSELNKKCGRRNVEVNRARGTGIFSKENRDRSRRDGPSRLTDEGRRKGGLKSGAAAVLRGDGFHDRSDPRVREGQLRGAKAPASRLLKHQLRMRNGTPILITREDDGHVFYFDSCTEAGQVLGLNRKTLRQHLDTNKSYKGHIIITFEQ